MRGQPSRIHLQRGLQPFADLGANGAGMDVVDLNAGSILVVHGGPVGCNPARLPNQVPKAKLVHSEMAENRNEKFHLVNSIGVAGGGQVDWVRSPSSPSLRAERSNPEPRKKSWVASARSLSSGAHSRDPLAPRNDGIGETAQPKLIIP